MTPPSDALEALTDALSRNPDVTHPQKAAEHLEQRLSIRCLTIVASSDALAPLARVTDERLREAVDWLRNNTGDYFREIENGMAMELAVGPDMDDQLMIIEAALAELQARRDADKTKCPYGKQDCGDCDWSDCKGCIDGHYVTRRDADAKCDGDVLTHLSEGDVCSDCGQRVSGNRCACGIAQSGGDE